MKSFELSFNMAPPTEPPAWANLVNRWYQLDAAAFALCEAYWQLQMELGPAPARIFICSPQASMQTDHRFIANPQPSHFVHTLANVRGSFLCQLMQWQGPLISFCANLEDLKPWSLSPNQWLIEIREQSSVDIRWIIL